MRGHGIHMWMCGVMIVVAFGLVLVSGSPIALIPVAGCVLMMLVMMRLMGGMGGPDDRS